MRTLRVLWLGMVAWSCSDPSAVSVGYEPSPLRDLVPPPPQFAADLLLYTTLDDALAVMTPTIGSGTSATIATSPADDFVASRFGAGLRANATGERVRYPQTDSLAQNVELERGTIEFWYRPFYNHVGSAKYSIIGTGNWSGRSGTSGLGSLHLGKHSVFNQYMIFLIFFDANGVRWEHNVAASDYSWNAAKWLLIRLTWDFGVPAGEQNLHLYLNGVEVPLNGQVSRGPQLVPAERPDEYIYVGSRDLFGVSANGVYDEFKVWNRVIPPI